AEDGIRDGHVTGVQTCALPIWMINEMLDLDRMEAGKIRIQPKPVDLNSLVREVVERAQASSEKHRLRTELDQALPIINADPDRRSEERRVGKEGRARWTSKCYK